MEEKDKQGVYRKSGCNVYMMNIVKGLGGVKENLFAYKA